MESELITRHALVCTDDERLESAVRSAGYRVIRVQNATDMETLLEREPFDLAVFDAHTDPGIQKQLRFLAAPGRRSLFLLLVTEDGQPKDRARAWRESVNAIISPEQFSDLRKQLDRWLEEERRFYEKFHRAATEVEPALGAH